MQQASHFPELKIIPGELPAYRQIADQVRSAILSGSLPASTRLPTVRDIAQMTGTSLYTVQDALSYLAQEGLIERSKLHGTRVKANRIQLTSLGIYFGALGITGGAEFYHSVSAQVCRQMEALGGEIRLFTDARAKSEMDKPLAQIEKAVQQNHIQGLVALMVGQQHIPWLQKLSIPLACLGGGDTTRSVSLDMEQFYDMALGQLKHRGVKTVSLIPNQTHGNNAIPVLFQQVLKRHQLTSLQIDREPIPDGQWEQRQRSGYDYLKALWDSGRHPEGLILFPDSLAQGAITALLERGVRVPEDVKLVIHRNLEMPFLCPMPADWISVSSEDVATKLFRLVKSQYEGKGGQKRQFFKLDLDSGY